MGMMPAAAVFLDRDGTLVHPRVYPSHPRELRLRSGLAPELRSLRCGGFHLVIVTNQSGIARGLFTLAELEHMHAELRRRLRRQGVLLDGIYACPHHPDGIIGGLAIVCECRKPAPGLLHQAAVELNVALERSWFVGDTLADMEAGQRAGCRTILIDLGTENRPQKEWQRPDFVSPSTLHALRMIRGIERLGPPVEVGYRPPGW